MDEVDLAQIHQERELELAIAAARGIRQARPRRFCRDCGDLLASHRVAAGICVDCLADEEGRARGPTRR